MESPVNKEVKKLLHNTITKLEDTLNADVLSYFGPIADGAANYFLEVLETLASHADKRPQLAVLLTTNGGSAMAVERFVNIIRKHYDKVIFIVPDYAFSAGTIFCMSGDEIWMDYFSVLGPIDPQIKNKDGKYVPALGYLDKVNELLEKAKKGKLSQAEFVILKDFDLAELRGYEQAKALTISLLKKWLVKYKFKNWVTHASSGTPVTEQDKEKRAEQIAADLGNNSKWCSHGRPINIEELEDLGLKIVDFSDRPERAGIREYYTLLQDFNQKYDNSLLIQTRLNI